jgi:energy-coupling factor transport system ATP-binding protein
LRVEGLTFTYPGEISALADLSFSLTAGEFVLLTGVSGCGKSTLLKLLKREIAPHGKRSGEIYWEGAPLSELDDRDAASLIGYVGQDPDSGIVTDKVWHELSFGLENLGTDPAVIRRRVGEMASYFGITDWYRRDTDSLSGGQKQILNLASILVMQPKLLILDEPTAQLDPIAAADFLATIHKLNRELGITVLVCEHRMEELFPMADRVLVLDEGKLILSASPREVAGQLPTAHPLHSGLPAAQRIFAKLTCEGATPPLTVREGRAYLESHYAHLKGAKLPSVSIPEGETVLELDKVWFRYTRNSPDLLQEASLSLRKSECFALLGGNGSGKTTLLKLASGLLTPYKGEVRVLNKPIRKYRSGELSRAGVALLPQSPTALFLCDTVEKDLLEIAKGNIAGGNADVVKAMADRLEIASLLARHPYDLSGGELQKCALAKLLLASPQILLLDEPTKGLDAAYKEHLVRIFRELKADGVTILTVTHDLEFAAKVADRAALFFDGEVLSPDSPRTFFAGNHFYTTATARISRDLFEGTILPEDVAQLCRGGKE